MKSFLLSLSLVAVTGLPLLSHAQVGINTVTPDAKAALDVTATDKGMLIPRLTQSQRLAITSPPQGLMIYQTDGTAGGGPQTGFWYYAGSPASWVYLSPAGDDLGNHTATQNLNLQGNALTGTGANIGTTVGVGIRADGGLNIGQNTTGNTVAVGYGAGAANTGSSNVFLGYNSGSNNTTGSNNTAVGYGAGPASGSGSLTNSTALGYGAQVTQSNSLVLGGTGSNAVNVGIGLTAPSATLDVNGTTRLRGLTTAGYVTTDAQGNLSSTSGAGWSLTGNALDGNQFIGSTNDQDFIVKRNNNEAFRVYSNGRISLGNNTSGSSSVLLGFNAGTSQSSAFYNVVIGARAGEQLNQSSSTFIGYGAGQQTTGNSNTLLGYYAGNRLTTGTNNVIIGNQAGYSGSYNITGTNNVVIGTSSGSSLTSNSNNILLGGNAQADAGLYDAYAIGSNANVTQGNSLVIGNERGTNDAVNVGIGSSAPSSTLQVNGTFAVGVVNGFGGGTNGGPNGLDQGSINNTTFVGSYYTLVPSSTSNQYYTLPSPANCPGRIYYLRNAGTTAARFVGSQFIEGSSNSTTTSFDIGTTGSSRSVILISDGTNWVVMRTGI